MFTQQQQQLVVSTSFLPIQKYKHQLVYAIEHYGIIIIVDETTTDSGKSTQIVQYLWDAGWCNNDFQIVYTQPNHRTVMELSKQVTYEISLNNTTTTTNTTTNSKRNTDDNVVGYTIPYDDTTNYNTAIKYVTPDVLIQEAINNDPLLSTYSVIIVDEIQQRTVDIDLLLGLLKKIRYKRPKLRILLMYNGTTTTTTTTTSASSDIQKLYNFFVPKQRTTNNPTNQQETTRRDDDSNNNIDTEKDYKIRKRQRRWDNTSGNNEPKSTSQNKVSKEDENKVQDGKIISIHGSSITKQHPVDVLHLRKATSNYINEMITVAYQIYTDRNELGDIICFVPTIDRIHSAIRTAEEKFYPNTDIELLPFHEHTPHNVIQQILLQQQQASLLTKPTKRRILFTTSFAESILSIPNIRHVIDCGLTKLHYFDATTGFDRSIVCPISHDVAVRRTTYGASKQYSKCYRLYTEQYMKLSMPLTTPPEILRTNPTSLLLTLKVVGIENVLTFTMLDLPSIESLSYGLETLYALGAIDDQTNITELGIQMSAFPTEPRISRMLLESVERKCSWEVLAVAAALQLERRNFLLQPKKHQQQLQVDYQDTIKDIIDPSGDHITYVNIVSDMDDHYYNARECAERFFNYSTLKRCIHIRNQLAKIMKSKSYRIQSIGLATDGTNHRSTVIRQCITAGFFRTIAKLGTDGKYYTLGRTATPIQVIPSQSNSLFTTYASPSAIATQYIVYTATDDGPRGGIELQAVSSIEAKWLREVAPNYWD